MKFFACQIAIAVGQHRQLEPKLQMVFTATVAVWLPILLPQMAVNSIAQRVGFTYFPSGSNSLEYSHIQHHMFTKDFTTISPDQWLSYIVSLLGWRKQVFGEGKLKEAVIRT